MSVKDIKVGKKYANSVVVRGKTVTTRKVLVTGYYRNAADINEYGVLFKDDLGTRGGQDYVYSATYEWWIGQNFTKVIE